MDQPKAYHLEQVYVRRITYVAQLHADDVILSVRHGSGKTLALWVAVPGLKALDKCVVRLHRKMHKRFYAIVAAANQWLAGFKELYATPAPLPTAIATVLTDSSTAASYDWKTRAAQCDALPLGRLYPNEWRDTVINHQTPRFIGEIYG